MNCIWTPFVNRYKKYFVDFFLIGFEPVFTFLFKEYTQLRKDLNITRRKLFSRLKVKNSSQILLEVAFECLYKKEDYIKQEDRPREELREWEIKNELDEKSDPLKFFHNNRFYKISITPIIYPSINNSFCLRVLQSFFILLAASATSNLFTSLACVGQMLMQRIQLIHFLWSVWDAFLMGIA